MPSILDVLTSPREWFAHVVISVTLRALEATERRVFAWFRGWRAARSMLSPVVNRIEAIADSGVSVMRLTTSGVGQIV